MLEIKKNGSIGITYVLNALGLFYYFQSLHFAEYICKPTASRVKCFKEGKV